MPLHRDLWWLLGSAVAAISAAPLLVQGDAAVTARRAAAVKRIEQMSPAERQRLDENFRRFEMLPAAEQAKYEQIHTKLEQNPQVGEALDVFAHWWPTVSPREQAELFKQADLKQRVAIVDRIQNDIDEDRVRRVYLGRGGWGWDWQRRDMVLPRETFYEIMETLEAMASESYLIQDKMPEIQQLPPRSPQRALKLIQELHARNQTWTTLVANPAAENRVHESITNLKFKELMKTRLGDRLFSASRSQWIRYSLMMSLGKELYLEGLKQNFGEEDLLKKLDSLSEEDKAEIYSYAADDGRFHLRSRVFKDLRAAFNPVPEFLQISGGMRPGDSRGRGDGPPRGNESGRPQR